MSSRRTALITLLLSGCADFERGKGAEDQPLTPVDGGGGTQSFATDVHPLLVSACRGCHQSGQAAGGTALLLSGTAESDYEVVLQFVDEDAPAESRLLSKASGVGHSGGAVFATATPEYQTLLAWIEGGALP